MAHPAALAASETRTSPTPLSVDRRLVRDQALKPVADKLARGQRLDRDDGLALMTSRDLIGLGALADALRREMNGRRAYYVVNQHLNYSNVCVNRCAFCAFWREADGEGAYCYTPQEAAARVGADNGLRVDEVHIVGSCHPDLGLDYYRDLLGAVRAARPDAAMKGFTPVEIAHMADGAGLDTGRVLDILIEAGLRAMPGGGAEVFSPRVRARLCPKKISGERWLAISGQAHRRGIPTNATMLYGHIETAEERVDHLFKLRDQQDESGGYSAFIPLAFHPTNTMLAERKPTTGLEDLRVIAASRLILDNFPHIKAYWVMLGPKLAQVALNFGADDLDGTIVEEKITHEAGATTAKGLTEAELRDMIEAGGFRPVRRDAFYNSVEQG